MALPPDAAIRTQEAIASTTPPAPPRKAQGPVGRRSGRDRHMLPGWYEWALREFARYFFALLVLSALAFVPLQMGESWLPTNGTAVMSVDAVTAIAAAFVIGVLVFAGFAYLYLWGEDGLIDRIIERHFDLIHQSGASDKD